MRSITVKGKWLWLAAAVAVLAIAIVPLVACSIQSAGPEGASPAAISRNGEQAAVEDNEADETGYVEITDADDVAGEAITAPDGVEEGAASEAPQSGSPGGAVAPQHAASQGDAPSSAPLVSSHVHDWRQITEPRPVIDVEAWTETRYRTVECVFCSSCGADITYGDSQGRSILEHGKAHALAGEGGGNYTSTKQVPDGVIEHPAKTHTEHVPIGWKCASCGEAKSA